MTSFDTATYRSLIEILRPSTTPELLPVLLDGRINHLFDVLKAQSYIGSRGKKKRRLDQIFDLPPVDRKCRQLLVLFGSDCVTQSPAAAFDEVAEYGSLSLHCETWVPQGEVYPRLKRTVDGSASVRGHDEDTPVILDDPA